MFPEAKARQVIDKKLTSSGWVLQDFKEFNPAASLGVANFQPIQDMRIICFLLIRSLSG
jgi:predicted type IV restriction endonuclease